VLLELQSLSGDFSFPRIKKKMCDQNIKMFGFLNEKWFSEFQINGAEKYQVFVPSGFLI
jgi:hypothetical protein